MGKSSKALGWREFEGSTLNREANVRYDVTDLFFSHPEQVRELELSTGGRVVSVLDEEKVQRVFSDKVKLSIGATYGDVVRSMTERHSASRAVEIQDLGAFLREVVRKGLTTTTEDFRAIAAEWELGDDEPDFWIEEFKSATKTAKELGPSPALPDLRIHRNILAVFDGWTMPPWEFFQYFLVVE